MAITILLVLLGLFILMNGYSLANSVILAGIVIMIFAYFIPMIIFSRFFNRLDGVFSAISAVVYTWFFYALGGFICVIGIIFKISEFLSKRGIL